MINILIIFLVIAIGDSEQNPSGGYRHDEQVLDNGPPSPINPQDLNSPEYKPEVPQIKLNLPSLHSPAVKLNAPDPENPIGNPRILAPPPPQQLNTEDIGPLQVSYVQEMTGQQWPKGIIPFVIDGDIYDSATTKLIVQAMSVIESASCVLFNELNKVPENTKDAWLHITNPKEERDCVHKNSIVNESETVVVLGFDCLHPDEILHALLHGIGFRDEVTHPRREQYIRVQWENIQPKYRSLFYVQDEDTPYKLVEYDPLSIMHFHGRAFSANGAATIVPVIPGLNIGGSHTLSQLDVMKLKLAFSHECNGRKISDLFESCKVALSGKKLKPKELAGSSAGEEHPDDVKNMNEEVNEEVGHKLNEEVSEEDGHNLNEEVNEEDGHNLNEGGNDETGQYINEGDTEKNVQKLDAELDIKQLNVEDSGPEDDNRLKMVFGKPKGRK